MAALLQDMDNGTTTTTPTKKVVKPNNKVAVQTPTVSRLFPDQTISAYSPLQHFLNALHLTIDLAPLARSDLQARTPKDQGRGGG